MKQLVYLILLLSPLVYAQSSKVDSLAIKGGNPIIYGFIGLILFHLIYSLVMTYFAHKGEKLNAFIWTLLIPPLFWPFIVGGVSSVAVSMGIFLPTLMLTIFIIVIIIPVALFFFMKKHKLYGIQE